MLFDFEIFMDIQYFNYNSFKNHLKVQNNNLDSSFSYDDFSNQNLKDNIYQKRFLRFKMNDEQNIYDNKDIIFNEQSEYENLLEPIYKSTFSTNNKIFSSIYSNALFSPTNKEIDNAKIKKEKIFNIIKVNNKIGRIKKKSRLKGKHNNLSQDNIIRKIKRRFLEKLRLYINYEYRTYLFKKFFKTIKNNNWLKKINPKISRKIKKEDNLKWFETKIGEIFSENISERYSNSSKDLNKRKIKRIFVLGKAENVIDILNSKIELYYNKYTNNEKISGFKTINDDVKELKIQMENTNQENIEEYLNKYEYIAKHLKEIFLQKKGRYITNKKEED